MALTDQLISYWKLEEASGTRVDSVVASANDLTDVNTVTQNPGIIGNSAQFVQANAEQLTRVSNATLQTGDIDFTLTAWAYVDSAIGAMVIAGKVDNGTPAVTEYYVEYDTATTRFRFNLQESGAALKQAVVIGAVTPATWYFVSLWYDSVADTLNGSVNNGATSTTAAVAAPGATAGVFRMGSLQGLRYWNGRIDEVGFWKRVLTAPERTALYNGGVGLSYPFSSGAGPSSFHIANRIGI